MTSLRIVLADDHPVVLAGIRALLQATPGIEVVGEAADGQSAICLLQAQRPDMVILDISLPDMTGIELARALLQECPDVRLLALTAHEDRAYLREMLAAGARGYLLKRSAAEELPRAVRTVAEGGLFLDPAVAGKLWTETAQPAADPGGLSPREEDVLRQTACGLSNKEIAAWLEISVKTVETYKARAVEKLELRSRADIVRYGAGRGWLDGLDGRPPRA